MTGKAVWRATALGGLALIALSVFPGVARGEGSQGNQRFVITTSSLAGTGRVVAVGPFSGVGEYRLLSHTDNPDGTSTDFDEFVFPEGRVFFSDTYTVQIGRAGSSCTWLIDVEGEYTITGGDGAYAGASGGGTFTAMGEFVAGRDESGTCLGFDMPPVAFTEVVEGVGTTVLS